MITRATIQWLYIYIYNQRTHISFIYWILSYSFSSLLSSENDCVFSLSQRWKIICKSRPSPRRDSVSSSEDHYAVSWHRRLARSRGTALERFPISLVARRMERIRGLPEQSYGNARPGTRRRPRRGDWRSFRVSKRSRSKVQVRVDRWFEDKARFDRGPRWKSLKIVTDWMEDRDDETIVKKRCLVSWFSDADGASAVTTSSCPVLSSSSFIWYGEWTIRLLINETPINRFV